MTDRDGKTSERDDDVWHITKDEAVAAVREQAFHVTDEDSSDHGRHIVHCLMSFTGADWDVEAVVDLIELSDDRAWFPKHWMEHDLAVLADARIYRFGVTAPARAENSAVHPGPGHAAFYVESTSAWRTLADRHLSDGGSMGALACALVTLIDAYEHARFETA